VEARWACCVRHPPPADPTGTNLLGLVKHLTGVELWYFGDAFGRPPRERPWSADAARNNADFWATADKSRDQIAGMYRRAWTHADQTIEAQGLDAIGHVPWWPAGGDTAPDPATPGRRD
jgi:hypothetical protein